MSDLIADNHIAGRWLLSPWQRTGLAGTVIVSLATAIPASAQDGCKAPGPVCAVRATVFPVSSAFDPYASAVRIGADLLVTNRHGVADETTVKLTLPNGKQISGTVVPTSYRGDLVLVRADLPAGPVLKPGGTAKGDLYTVGQDISARRVKVFPKGVVLRNADMSRPYARLHHTAYTQPGVSGGAVVTADGAFVAIATSGGAGRFEAIPVVRIDELKTLSGDDHKKQSADIGRAYRDCIVDIEKAGRVTDALPDDIAGRIEEACLASSNRQLFDLAGQALGRARKLDQAISFFNRSLGKDPNAINARIGLVITLMFAQKNEDAVAHVRWLMGVVPESTEVQRFAIHVGKRAGEMALAEEGLALVAKHNPGQYEAAKRFLAAPVPARRQR